MPPKLSVRNLFKVFGPRPGKAIRLAGSGFDKDAIFRETRSVVAVNDISFDLAPGEIFVVMGLSGSGKSTLVRCLNRLVDPSRGSIRVDGTEIADIGREALRQIRLRKISMVFQHFALFPHKTVLENAEYGLKMQGVSPQERRERALQALDAVGLSGWTEALPEALSGGMRQRVGIARALAVNPEVLLMDEPFGALDPLIRAEMQKELLRLRERYNCAIVFISHDLNEALSLGDRIAIMKDGRFVQVGTAHEIVTEPADDYVAAFTRDVDRSRVLPAAVVTADLEPLIAGHDRVGAARERLEEVPHDSLPVVDGTSRFIGLVDAESLADRPARLDVREAIRKEAAAVQSDAPIVEVFGQCAAGHTVPVVSASGRYKGVIDPLQVFAVLGKDQTNGEAEIDGRADDEADPMADETPPPAIAAAGLPARAHA
ncbi:MAG: quaternary amine ABC transporter ATP-binding protein [Pseudochelatococcus sp.]|uniref:quaternary amine ABC transporter ATP-binding protein n=1 Tax=Pseudochelatococcus sp. TaxID=2020869 RepID=UPI003D8D248A